MKQWKLILASGSPRRKQLLEQVGLVPIVRPDRGEEPVLEGKPEEVVASLASLKAARVDDCIDPYAEPDGKDYVVLGSDTVVACDGRILGKPADETQAFLMLKSLSGRSHQVFTGVSLRLHKAGMKEADQVITFAVSTQVFFARLTEKEILRYIATKEPMDKAGAYGIQGKGAVLVEKIDGDYNNVVGLPLYEVCARLQKEGFEIDF